MGRVKLLVIGGYLGAGKTTLLGRLAHRLADRGDRVGLITNDQAADLVDTAVLSNDERVGVREVAGRCFCCGFEDLLGAAESLRGELAADVLIAEPVGSCTDLSATILQPLKDRYASSFELSPLTVLADPRRLTDILLGRPGSLHAFAAYIYRKQLEEADVIAINKADLLDGEQRARLESLAREQFPGAEVVALSAATGEGVDPWLDAMLKGGRAGQRLLDIDYDTYAAGEAVLGWLNAAARLTAVGQAPDWPAFAERLMRDLHQRLQAARSEVGHVKMILQAGGGSITANLTSLHGPPAVRGEADETVRHARMTFNARVETSPAELESIVRAAFAAACDDSIELAIDELRCLQPGRPEPTHRYSQVVA